MHGLKCPINSTRIVQPGGAQVSARSMVRIDSPGVVGDNLWLWRADHEEGGAILAHARI